MEKLTHTFFHSRYSFQEHRLIWADNVAITAGAGTTIAADEVSDGTLGSVKVQYVKIMDGTLNGTDKAAVSAAGIKVDLGADNDVTVTSGTITTVSSVTAIANALPAGTNAIGKLAANSGVDIGDVDVTSLPALAAGTNNIGDVDVLTVPADPFGANADASSATGSISAKLRFIASTGIPVTGTVTVGSHAVTNAGTFAVQDATAQASLSVMDDWDNAASDGASVSGDTAHDSVDAGEPVKIGLKAKTSPKGLTLVADGDRTDALGDSDGMQMTKLNTSFADIVSERVTDTGGTSTAFSNFTAVASTKNYVTTIVVYNTSATAGYVDFRDGTGGSVLWTMPIPAAGGAVLSAATPIFKTSANTALAYDVSGALTTVYISVSGFQSKV